MLLTCVGILVWIHLYVRCQNCNHKTSPVESKPKKPKIEPTGKHSYPALQGEPEDATAHEKNKDIKR